MTGAARLLFVSPTTGFPPVVGVQPRVVVVDAAAEPGADWIATASDWAAAHRSVVVTVVDLHEEVRTASAVASIKSTVHAAQSNPPASSHNTWIV